MFLKDLENKAFVCPEFYDSLNEKKPSSRRRKTCFLIKKVTLFLAPSYEATNEMRGRSQVVLYQQLPASNLCPAPNGSARYLHLS